MIISPRAAVLFDRVRKDRTNHLNISRRMHDDGFMHPSIHVGFKKERHIDDDNVAESQPLHYQPPNDTKCNWKVSRLIELPA